jgi:hypothetical protein
MQQFRQAFGCAACLRQLAPHFRQLAESAGGNDGIEHELAERACRHRSVQDVLRAVPQHANDASEHHEDGKPGEKSPRADGGTGGLERVFHGGCVTRSGGCLAVEGLDGPRRADRLRSEGRCARQRVLSGARALPDGAAERHQGEDYDRDRAERQTGQLRARVDHHRHGAEAEDRVPQGLGGGRPECRLDLDRIGGQARDDLAGLVDVEKGGGKRRDAGEHIAAKVGDDALADGDDEVVAQGARQCEECCQGQQHLEIVVDERPVSGGKALIDHAAHGERQGERGGRRQREREKRADDEAAIAGEIGQQPCQGSDGLAFRLPVFFISHFTPRSDVRFSETGGTCASGAHPV